MVSIAFVGAGSVVFTRQLVADILRYPELADARLVLHDIDPERLRVAEGTARQVSRQLGASATVEAYADRRRALDGVDFVVNMIQVGGIDATLKDLKIPARHGLRQTIGDTTGVGGVFRALRTFPVLEGVATDMRELCPQAWLLNYTNPMAMNVWWVSTVAPDLKVAGLCHSGLLDRPRPRRARGRPGGGDAVPCRGRQPPGVAARGTTRASRCCPGCARRSAATPGSSVASGSRSSAGSATTPTETSEHSSEYVSWFLRSDEQIERYRLQPLEYVGISPGNVAEFEAARRALAAGEDLALEDGASEYAPQIIHSLVTRTRREVHVNVPNHGLVDNLPQDAVVEVPAEVDGDGLRPGADGLAPGTVRGAQPAVRLRRGADRRGGAHPATPWSCARPCSWTRTRPRP